MSHSRNSGLVHILNNRGHRLEYQNLFCALLDYRALTCSFKGSYIQLVGARNLVCATVDGDIPRFFMLALFRALLGRKTIGILVNPKKITDRKKSSRHRALFVLLKILKVFYSINVLSIMPYALQESAKKISDDWIYDPQFWDLQYLPELILCPCLTDSVETHKDGRQVIGFIGKVAKNKGLLALLDLVEERSSEVFVIIAGKVEEDCLEEVSRIEAMGMKVINRFVTNEEIATIYEVSDFIWCYYEPEYDQSSGIFGRAFQLGKPVVIRRKSILEKIVYHLGGTTITLPSLQSNEKKTDCKMVIWTPPNGSRVRSQVKDISVRKVRSFLS